MNKYRSVLIFLLIGIICGGILLTLTLQKRSLHTNITLSDQLKNLLRKSNDSTLKKDDDTKENDTKKNTSDISIESVQLPLVRFQQENDYYCGPASLQMVLRYHGIDKTQTDLANDLNTHPVTGTEYVDLAKTANRYLFHHTSIAPDDIGYHVQTLTRYDTSPEISITLEKRVKQDIGTNDPVFAAVDMHALYPNMPSTNHFIVITGYALQAGTDSIAYVYYLDPYNQPQDEHPEEVKTVTKEQLIHAIIVNVEPAYIW